MKETPKKTGIIYARVSSWEQVSNTSLDKQVRDCREYAMRHGIEIITEPFIEEGESAKTANRTEFQKALAFCAKHKPTHFIVYKVDRFARNQDDHVATKVILKKYKTQLASVTEPIDGTTMGRAMEGMLSVFAELDNNVRSERSKGGMMEKFRRGIWVWKAPIGYKRLVKGGNLIIDETTSPYIKLLFEKYSTGTYSYEALAVFLSTRGFKTRAGKKIFPQLVEKIIHNPIYYGVLKVWGEEHKGTFESIIEESLFWKCQPGVRPKSHFTKGDIKNPNFPLRKFAVCSICQIGLTGSSSTGRKGKKYPYYHHHKQGCVASKAVPKETLEQNFVEHLQDISPKPRFEKVFTAIVADIWKKNYKKLDADHAEVEKEITNLKAQRQRIFDLYEAAKYTDEEFMEQKKNINIRIQQKELLREEKKIEEFNMDEALEYTFNFVRQSADTWIRLKKLPAHRVRFQNRVFPEKVPFDGQKFGTAKMSLIYEMNQQTGANKSKLVTHISRDWNQLLWELNQWRLFGMALQEERDMA